MSMLEAGQAIARTPLGDFRIWVTSQGVARIVRSDAPINATSPSAERAARELEELVAGNRASLELPIDAHGTEFEQRVWAALAEIPRGRTESYSSIAERIGRPGAARAVGAACRKNPVPIVVPCHRVVGKSGALTGYALGLSAKEWLLEVEGARGTTNTRTPAGRVTGPGDEAHWPRPLAD
ncbi:MAG: methylated-DNA--[protein]-cysteine S-methyltransferase [Deltaproteobacteria bacterium]|nr:methylated-DNA--[protein]-cysteine S-methyltransferase [Deltaproteobacteria bacterium]